MPHERISNWRGRTSEMIRYFDEPNLQGVSRSGQASKVIKRPMDADNRFGLRDDLPTRLMAFRHEILSLLGSAHDSKGFWVEMCLDLVTSVFRLVFHSIRQVYLQTDSRFLQGCTKRWAPGFVKMRRRSCVLLPVVGKQNATFHPISHNLGPTF